MARTVAGSRQGFTLLELLIAIFIFSVVIGTVYGSYRTAFTNIQSSEQQARIEERARVILERVEIDLESAFAGEGGFLKGTREELGDMRGDELQFTSTAHLVLTRKGREAGVAVIGYSLEEDGETGQLSLFRSDIPFLPAAEEDGEEEVKGLLLGEDMLEFRLDYIDGDGGERDEWDSEIAGEGGQGDTSKVVMPAMITITIRLAESPEDGVGRLFRTAVAPLPGPRT